MTENVIGNIAPDGPYDTIANVGHHTSNAARAPTRAPPKPRPPPRPAHTVCTET